MHRRRLYEIVGLGALAVVTGALVVSVVMARPTPVTAIPAPPAELPTGNPSTIWAPATPTATASPTSTPKVAPSSVAVPPQSAAPKLPKNGLNALAALLKSNEPASILVLGDGSGDGMDEWVAVWARDYLAKQRTVTYSAWDDQAGDYGASVTFGSGTRTVAVWNASRANPDLAAEAARANQAWRGANVVIYSYGHGVTSSALTKNLPAIQTAVRAKNGSVREIAMIQNPERVATEVRQRATTQTVQDWADRAAIASLDVYNAFIGNRAARVQLVKADGYPTSQGSTLWAKTLSDALAAR